MKSFIEINNKNMEVLQIGKDGIPILILTGMACSFEEWIEITQILSRNDRVIMYHRPGLGASEIGAEKRTTAQSCEEIICLLESLNVTEPILLIAHSYGGLIAQHFAKLHPRKVRALVLVDSTSEDLEKLDELHLPILNNNATDEDWINACKNYAEMTEKDLETVLQTTLTEAQKRLPHHIQQSLIEFQHKPNLYKAMKSEVENWKEDARIVKELGHLNRLPLRIIGRDKSAMIKLGIMDGLPEEELTILEEVWEKLIKDQVLLSSDNKLIFAENAGHAVYLDRPELIIETVKEVKKSLSLL